MKYGLSEKQLTEITDIFSTYPEIETATLFGSRAIDTYKEASDVDIAIQGEHVDVFFAAELKDHFEEDTYLPFFFDVVDYGSITSEELKRHIRNQGVVIYRRGGSEWREYTFRGLLDRPVRNGIYKKKEFHGRGCKIVNMGELFAHTRLEDVAMKRVELSSKEKEKSLLEKGDLIFARRSLTAEGAGKCCLVHKITEDTTFESSIIRARPDHQKATSEFLYYYFNSRYGKYLLGTILRQVAVAGITGSDLMGLVLKVPPLPEQKAIASVLSSLDDKIDLLHRQNKTLEAMAETLFRQWFVEEAQEDWEEKPLDEVAEYLNGLACQKYLPKNDVDKLPVLTIKELRNGFTDNSDWATADVKEDYIVRSGDIIFSWSGSLLVKIWNGIKCVLNQHLFKVTSDIYPKWFIYLWTKFHLKKFIAIAESKTTTMWHIKRKDLSHSMVVVPTKPELDHMNGIADPLIDKIILNHGQLIKLEKLRDTLLPKLMSGEVRVEYEQDE